MKFALSLLATLAVAGLSTPASAQVTSARQVLSACPDVTQAESCVGLATAYLGHRGPSDRRDRQIVDLVVAVAEAAQQSSVSPEACANAADGLRVLATGVTTGQQARQINDIADALCTGTRTAAIATPRRGFALFESLGGGSDGGGFLGSANGGNGGNADDGDDEELPGGGEEDNGGDEDTGGGDENTGGGDEDTGGGEGDDNTGGGGDEEQPGGGNEDEGNCPGNSNCAGGSGDSHAGETGLNPPGLPNAPGQSDHGEDEGAPTPPPGNGNGGEADHGNGSGNSGGGNAGESDHGNGGGSDNAGGNGNGGGNGHGNGR